MQQTWIPRTPPKKLNHRIKLRIWWWQTVFLSLHIQLAFRMGKRLRTCVHGRRGIGDTHFKLLLRLAPCANDAQCVLFCDCAVKAMQVMDIKSAAKWRKSAAAERQLINWQIKKLPQTNLIHKIFLNSISFDIFFFLSGAVAFSASFDGDFVFGKIHLATRSMISIESSFWSDRLLAINVALCTNNLTFNAALWGNQ